MVVFTCNNCGDSLQKPKVEKHYVTVCRTSKNLTCVDCLKDFREEAYVAHTKCITEEERYSAKGSVTNVIKKGEAKQQQWVDMINELIQNNNNATGPQKIIFQIMSSQTDNVPRKRMKFLNFIKNAGGNKIMYGDIEKVWDLIERHKSEHAAFTEGSSATTEEVSKPSEKDETNNEKVEVPVNGENAEPSKKKKKRKSKHSESDVISDKIESQEKSSDEKKRKKRKSDVHENANVVTDVINENGSPQLNGNEEKKSKKRKSANVQEGENAAGDNEQNISNLNGTNTEKKKKKSKDGLDNVTETNSLNQNSSHNDSISKEKKNKKKKLQVDQESTEVEMKKTKLDDTSTTDILPEVADANKSISKQKKKKRKSETSQEVTNVPVVEDAEVKVNKNDSNATDDLSRIILKALQKKNILSLVKLQKKVIGEYCKEANITESPKLIKQFNKQLKKIKGVEVVDNNVILKTLDEC